MVITETQTELEQEQTLQRAEAELAASLAYLRSKGIQLPDSLLDMRDWLTIKRYAEKYKLSQQVVVNWIGRGIIPADCTRIVPELNDMRLVRDQPYK